VTAQNALIWERSVDDLAASIDAYAASIERAVLAAAAVLAARAEEDAKNNAPWTDRTGDAREGLHAFVADAQGIVSIYLAHGPDIGYDIYLETLRGGQHAIIAPTLEALLPEVWDAVRKALE
jgi:hypothetical protein